MKTLLDQLIHSKEDVGKTISEIDNGVSSGSVEVVFRNIESRVVEVIDRYSAAYGCVAWLTNVPIMQALARREDTTILVQKEDFLRPDVGGADRRDLRDLYGRLRVNTDIRYQAFGYQFSYNFNGDFGSGLDAVRCVGYAPDSRRTTPKMHNKFLVLCENTIDGEAPDVGPILIPRVVITGSFNMTSNATRSLENIVIIRDDVIARAYMEEFSTIFALSEPLNWKHRYVAPHYSAEYGFSPEVGT